jgi:hypothetical protein
MKERIFLNMPYITHYNRLKHVTILYSLITFTFNFIVVFITYFSNLSNENFRDQKSFLPINSATENLPYLCVRLAHSPCCTGTVSDKLKAKQGGA